MKSKHLKQYLLLLLLISVLSNCRQQSPLMQDVPDIRSYNASKACDEIIYATNIHEIYRLWLLKGVFKSKTVTNVPLEMDPKLEVFPKGISCDCNMIAMFGLDKDQQVRAPLFLYDLINKRSIDLNRFFKTRIEEFAFSPANSQAAFLDSAKNLHVCDYKSFKDIYKGSASTGVKFSSVTWSPKGKYIYLTDSNTSIWRMRLSDNSFFKVWQAPFKSKESRSITGDAKSDDIFYFRSDHESDFLQLYKFDPALGVRRLFNSNYDENLSGLPVENDSLYIKTYRNSYVDVRLFAHGKIKDVITGKGVVFDYFPGAKEVVMFSDYTHPYSVYQKNGDKFVSVINGIMDSMPAPQMVKNDSGADNMVFYPTGPLKKWMVYLHGGPRQQVFQKYDKFIAYFLKSGIGVIVLNYPGSTGFGKKYQIDNHPDRIVVEVKDIHHDLEQIRSHFHIVDKVAILGISFSAILAHLYTLNYNDADQLIDLSGIGAVPAKKGTSVLYVYGKNDFALDNQDRIKMINADLKKGNGKSFTVDGEGHVIAHRTSTLAIMKQMADFLRNE